jgi:ribonuclease HI
MRHAAGQYVIIKTDSQLWVNTLSRWAPGWERRSWIKSNGEPVANLEMVQTALALFRSHPVQLQWVRGHANDRGNNCADFWAGQARVEGITAASTAAQVRPAVPQKRNCF